MVITTQQRQQAQERIKSQQQRVRQIIQQKQKLISPAALRSRRGGRAALLRRQEQTKKLQEEKNLRDKRIKALKSFTKISTIQEAEVQRAQRRRQIRKQISRALEKGIPTKRIEDPEAKRIVQAFRRNRRAGQQSLKKFEKKEEEKTKITQPLSFKINGLTDSQKLRLQNITTANLTATQLQAQLNRTKIKQPFFRQIKNLFKR